VETYKGDIGFDAFLFIKKILEQIAKGYAFGKFIEIARELKPPNQDPQSWTTDIVSQGKDFSTTINDLDNRITELIEFRVKVRDFQDTVSKIINDYSNLMRDVIMFCLKVLKQSRDKNLLDQAIFVFSLYYEGVSYVYRLSTRWQVDIEPPFLHTADFISMVISSNFRVQSEPKEE
jgi:hypothetical protein